MPTPDPLPNPLYTAYSQIPYWEFPDNFEEQWQDDNSRVVRHWACRWQDREKFLVDVVGDARKVGSSLQRDLPHPDPEVRGFYAVDMRMVKFSGWPGRETSTSAMAIYNTPPVADPSTHVVSRATDRYGLAHYLITFAKPLYQVLSDEDAHASGVGELSRFVVPTREPGGETIDFPGRGLKFTGDTDDQFIPALPPFLFPTETLAINWVMVPQDAVPYDTIEGNGTPGDGAIGCVNDAAFPPQSVKGLRRKFPAETLLCLAPQERLYQGANTQTFVDLKYVFSYRPQGWNKFLKGGSPVSFQSVVRIGDTSNGPFLKFDFKKLFDVGNP